MKPLALSCFLLAEKVGRELQPPGTEFALTLHTLSPTHHIIQHVPTAGQELEDFGSFTAQPHF